jgi:hypothetical protein
MREIFTNIVHILNEYYLGKGNEPSTKPLPNALPHVSDTKIRFVHETFFYRNDELFASEDITKLQKYLETNHLERLQGINIYIVRNPNAGGGAANTPRYNMDNINLYILDKNHQAIPETLPIGAWGYAVQIAHELGHNFGLLHTYRPTCCPETEDINNPDFLWDVFELEGENIWPCFDPYDGICYHEYLPNWECNPGESLSGCTNNLMSSTGGVRWKSPLQIGRMRRALSMQTTRKYAYGYHSTPHRITQNETWDFSIKFYQDIIVEPGATLTIMCDVQMVPQAKIVIRPGGKLIIDGGRIGTDYFAKSPWQGIYVVGDRNKPQNFKSQGALILKNGAIIENSKYGVLLRGVDTADYPYNNWHHNGGIVQATDAIFRNNWRNVSFYAYRNLDVNNNEISNISFFRGVTFETTSETPHDSHISNVSMWSVKGVRFSSCVFKDSSSNKRDGILAYDASFNVNQCSFTGLQYSIYAQSPNSNNTFNITNSTFNSYRGIYMNMVDNVQIRNNTFKVQPPFSYDINDDCSNVSYGIYINYSTNFKIDNNRFDIINVKPPLFTPTCGPVGIVLRHTGDFTNELYRNEFSGLMIGIQAQGNNKGLANNKGLLLHCNNLDRNYYDFHVKYVPRSRIPGIRELQGYGNSNASLAGNLFGHNQSVLLSNFVVDSECGNIAYFHHNPASEPRVVPLIYSEDKITLWGSPNEYTPGISCPDKAMVVKPYEEVVLEKDYSLTKYEETTLSLRALVDAGNSNDLKRSIEESGPAPNNSLYNYLMEIAPFLSEDVLATLAAKERGFTNVMIRNVLVKSPQAPKLDMVVEKLNNRNIPLPPPMRKQIDEGIDYFGEKELLEQEQAFYKTNYELALNEILINKIQETEGWEDAPAVEDILASIDDVRYKYLLAEQLFEKGEYDQGMQLLSSIDAEYSVLESNSAENHLDYISFYSLLQQVNLEESPGYTNLSAETLEALESFIDSDSRVAGKAIAILLMNEAIEYNEPIYFPELENEIKSETAYVFTELDSSDFIDVDNMQSVYLYPNPAQDNISINWCVEYEKSLNATIDIYNSNGTLMYSNSERSGCSSLNISVSGWMSGTYTAIFNYGTKSKNINFIIAN